MNRNPYDIVGKTFGQLQVVEHIGVYQSHYRVYLAKCACGRFKAIRRDSLVEGNSKSCGHSNGRTEGKINTWGMKTYEEQIQG